MIFKAHTTFRAALWACFLLAFGGKIHAAVTLPKLFADHAVLQREVAVPVWGWALPGEAVTIRIAGQILQTKADRSGNWRVQLAPHAAGGPFEMTIQGNNTLVLHDILFGEVWVCGGQSNMQWTLNDFKFKADPALDTVSVIRMFTVHIDLDYLPKKDVKGGNWQVASLENVIRFSATGYYFGRYLQAHLKVPIGLISSNLGATSIETWMSAGALKPFPQFGEVVGKIESSGKSFDQINANLKTYRKDWDAAWYFKNDSGIAQHWEDPATDISDWKDMAIPNLWEDAGLPNYDGSVWFRKSFDLPDGFKGDTFNIALNQIDDYDIAWVNGVKIGETFGNRNWRNYFFPANILKPKGNVLVVRVFDAGGKGGMYSNAFWGNPILVGQWKYKPGVQINAATFPKPEVVNGSFFTHPSLLYNGNIAPLQPYAIKGAIWYQGESNPERAVEYHDLLPAMIKDWRRHWGQGDFPFLIVQLANYYPEAETPGESTWAEIRDAQMGALALPQTAVATAIDLGDASDIHPKNKTEVGVRLGLAARKIAYGEDLVFSGPRYQSMAVEGNKIRVTYTATGGGLIAKNKYGFLKGFAIAGADKKFYWAMAYIDGNSVVVFSPKVPAPVAIRYAWSDNPGPLDLYNQEGLPALPFRTDNWPMSTIGKVFLYDENGF
jgi:sialate O-acetylesterase